MMGIEPMTSSLPRKHSTPELHRLFSESTLFQIPFFLQPKKDTSTCVFGYSEGSLNLTNHPKLNFNIKLNSSEIFLAGDRVRTGDIQLGRLTLYQLSYSRIINYYLNLFFWTTNVLKIF